MTKRSFEYTVLAFLDGMLDPREKAEFLRDVARDPEKQSILSQYRQLDAALEKQRSGLPPLHTERALAERLTILRSLPPAARPVPFPGKEVLASIPSRRRARIFITAVLLLASMIAIRVNDGPVIDTRNPDTFSESTTLPTNVRPVETERFTATEREGPPLLSNSRYSTIGKGSSIGSNARDARSSAGSIPSSVEFVAPPAQVGGQRDDVDKTELPVARIAMLPSRKGQQRADIAHRPTMTIQSLFGTKLRGYIESGAASQQWRGSGAHAGENFGGVYLFGVQWELTPVVSLGLELGNSVFAQEIRSTRTTAVEGSPEVGILLVDNTFESVQRTWLRAGLLYSVNPMSAVVIQPGAGAGLTLDGDRSLVFSFGISALYPVSTRLRARAGIHYTAAWFDPPAAPPLTLTADTGPVGLIYLSESPGPVYTSSIEFRIGFGVELW